MACWPNAQLQNREFVNERIYGDEAVKHQTFVGTGYFDMVTQVIAGENSSTTALTGSTEVEQFAPASSAAPPEPAAEAQLGPGKLPAMPAVAAKPAPPKSRMRA